MFLVFDWWLDVIWLKSHRNTTYCIDFNIVICILNTPVSAKMAQGQRKWRADIIANQNSHIMTISQHNTVLRFDSSIIALPVNFDTAGEIVKMRCRELDIYIYVYIYIIYHAFDNRYGFSVSAQPEIGDGGGRPSSVMSLGVTSVGGRSHGHPASPIGVGSSWEDIDPRSPEPLVVRGGWLWLIWVVRWTT